MTYAYGPVNVELKIPARRLWAAMKDLKTVLPKMMSLMRATVEVDGDGGPGTIRAIRFSAGVATKVFTLERIEVMDEATFTEIHTLLGGEAFNPYSFYRSTRIFIPLDNNTTIVSWSVEYEPLDEFLRPDATKGMFLAAFKALEAYLLAHDDYMYTLVE